MDLRGHFGAFALLLTTEMDVDDLKGLGFRPSHDQGYGCRHTFLNWFYLSQWGRETACGQGESAFYNTFSKNAG